MSLSWASDWLPWLLSWRQDHLGYHHCSSSTNHDWNQQLGQRTESDSGERQLAVGSAPTLTNLVVVAVAAGDKPVAVAAAVGRLVAGRLVVVVVGNSEHRQIQTSS